MTTVMTTIVVTTPVITTLFISMENDTTYNDNS